MSYINEDEWQIAEQKKVENETLLKALKLQIAKRNAVNRRAVERNSLKRRIEKAKRVYEELEKCCDELETLWAEEEKRKKLIYALYDLAPTICSEDLDSESDNRTKLQKFADFRKQTQKKIIGYWEREHAIVCKYPKVGFGNISQLFNPDSWGTSTREEYDDPSQEIKSDPQFQKGGKYEPCLHRWNDEVLWNFVLDVTIEERRQIQRVFYECYPKA